jgi:membrane protease YdiL (CAAX protease family)
VLRNQNWKGEAVLRVGLILFLSVHLGNAMTRIYEAGTDFRQIISLPLLSNIIVMLSACGAMIILFAKDLLPRHPIWSLFLLGLTLVTITLDSSASLLHEPTMKGTQTAFPKIVIGSICFQAAMIGLAIWASHQHQTRFWEAYGFKNGKPIKIVAYGALFGLLALAFQTMYVVLTTRFSIEVPEQEVVQIIRQTDGFWAKAYLGFFATVLAPLGEELFFRGMVYPTLRERVGILWGTVISSAIFTLIHFNPIETFLPLFVLAVSLTLAYELTSNILASIVAHSMFNLANFIAVNLTKTG